MVPYAFHHSECARIAHAEALTGNSVDKGFADEIMFQDEQVQAFNSVGSTVVPKATLNKFRNMKMKLADEDKKSDSAILLNKKLEILRGDN